MSAQIPGSLLNPRISSSVLNQEIKTGKNLLRFFVELIQIHFSPSVIDLKIKLLLKFLDQF
jgi:hypothetical protein